MDPTARQSIIDRINQATNILVTVKNSPSVDQLAGCIGLTLFLNHIEKHGTAVFSGAVPSTMQFLKPEETIEKTTDSLRDFIIALDKGKADKLRYKVENDVVKIFITPYRTSLTQKDFDFSQGDFNVDVVIALGVHAKEDLDDALVQHGRILHDATVISLNNGPGGNVGTLHLEDPNASSLCEMLLSICEGLKPNSIDMQMATAFLTGIVAETERFSNPKTTPQAMSLAAKLMAAGANQQLIATQLQGGAVGGQKTSKKSAKKGDDDGTLTIEHEEDESKDEATDVQSIELPEIVETKDEPAAEPEASAEKLDDSEEVSADLDAAAEKPDETPATPARGAISNVRSLADTDSAAPSQSTIAAPGNSFPLDPPSRGGPLTANMQPQPYDPSTDPLSQSQTGTTMQHGDNLGSAPVIDSETISGIEQDVNSPHVQEQSMAPGENVDEARKAVEAAANKESVSLDVPQATGASYLDPGVQQGSQAPLPAPTSTPQPPAQLPSVEPLSPPDLVPKPPLMQNPAASAPLPSAPTGAPSAQDILGSTSSADASPPLLDPNPTLKMPDNLAANDPGLPPAQLGTVSNQTAPPPVPPPMMPPAAPTN